MKYLLLVALLFLACGHEQVELTLRNACVTESQVDVVINNEIYMHVSAGQVDNEFLNPGTHTFEFTLHKREWPFSLIVLDTIDIAQDITCIAFYNISTGELIKWE